MPLNNDFSTMVTVLCKPGLSIINELTPIKVERLHMAVGLAGECFELLSCVAFDLKVNKDPAKLQAAKQNRREELGDIEFYLEGLCQIYSIDSADINSFEVESNVEDHLINCLLTTAGEILDLVKKEVIYNKDAQTSKIAQNLILFRNYLNDYYTSVFGGVYARDEVMQENMDKLLTGENARFKDGIYSNKAAQERADKK